MFKPRIAGREVQSADIMLTENGGEGEAGIMSRTKETLLWHQTQNNRWYRRPGFNESDAKSRELAEARIRSTVSDSKNVDHTGAISSDGYLLVLSNRLNASSAHISSSP